MADTIMAKSKKGNNKRNNNSFAGIPRAVMDSPDYISLSGGAVRLLLELARQYRGKNNGDLTAAHSVVHPRGCGAKDTIKERIKELINRGMIVESRDGVFSNPGSRCNLYALSWAPIDECPGKRLSLKPTTTPPRKFSLENNKEPGPETGHGSSQKLGRQADRNAKGRFSSSQKLGRLRVIA